jgi:uncharacterized beta-barrel protein YwiB (DUF1934 family)
VTKDVLISIQGLQFAGGEVDNAANDEELDKIETICTGEYYYRNNAHYIMYDEIVDNMAEAPVKNMIKLKGDEFTLNKKGDINVQMVFSQGRKTMTQYFTPFGNIMIAVDTKSVEYKEAQDSLYIHINYGLEANYQFVADCNITIDVKSNTNKKSQCS